MFTRGASGPAPGQEPDRPASHAHGSTHLHSHDLGSAGAGVRTAPAVRLVTLALLILVAAATAIGLVQLWPDYAKVAEVAERASYQTAEVGNEQGRIVSVGECETPQYGQTGPDLPPGSESGQQTPQGGGQACQLLSVGLLSGPDEGQLAEVEVRGNLATSGLRAGDRVELFSFPGGGFAAESGSGSVSEAAGGAEGDGAAEDGATATEANPEDGGASGATANRYELAKIYEVGGIVRHLPLAILALLFVGVVIAVGRLRGFFAILALGVAAGVLLGFVLPALVAGGPALLIGLVGSSAIMFVTLFFVHGPNMRTTSALIGTLAGIVIISGVSWLSVRVTRLSGVGDEASGLLSSMVSEIDFRGLLACSILIAGLGVLNDVTITQASSVWELRAAAPDMPRREIYARAMRIGRDHIASTVYTVFFAYAGAAISTLIVLYLYNRPVLSLLTQEDIAIEIVRTVAGSIGLVLAVPITTAVAALFVPPARAETASPWRDPVPGSAGEQPGDQRDDRQ